MSCGSFKDTWDKTTISSHDNQKHEKIFHIRSAGVR